MFDRPSKKSTVQELELEHERLSKSLGRDHVNTVRAKEAIAEAYAEIDIDRAVQLQSEIHDDELQKFGSESHPWVKRAETRLARFKALAALSSAVVPATRPEGASYLEYVRLLMTPRGLDVGAAAALQDGVETWNDYRRVRSHDSSWVSLEFVDLSDRDLRGANFSRVRLRNADLSGARLNRATFYRADLTNADLRTAVMGWRVDVEEANFRRADVRGANLRGCYGFEFSGYDKIVYNKRTKWPPQHKITSTPSELRVFVDKFSPYPHGAFRKDDQDNRSVERKQSFRNPLRRPSPRTVLSLVLGALSYIQLTAGVVGFDLLTYFDTILANYLNLVETVFAALFGWIDLLWLGISAVESHVVVVAAIHARTWGTSLQEFRSRFERTDLPPEYTDASKNRVRKMIARRYLGALAGAILLPDPIGWLGILGVVGFVTVRSMLADSEQSVGWQTVDLGALDEEGLLYGKPVNNIDNLPWRVTQGPLYQPTTFSEAIEAASQPFDLDSNLATRIGFLIPKEVYVRQILGSLAVVALVVLLDRVFELTQA